MVVWLSVTLSRRNGQIKIPEAAFLYYRYSIGTIYKVATIDFNYIFPLLHKM